MANTLQVNVGKTLRFRRLVDKSGPLLMVPLDHGYTLGPVKGLVNTKKTVEDVFSGGASCVIVHKGLARSLTNSIPAERGLLIHVSGSTSHSPNPNLKVLTGSVGTAIRLGADGISCHVNMGADDDFQMLGDLAELAEDADLAGMPLLAMMYARGSDSIDKIDPDSLGHVARVAEESGADIVKVNATDKGKHFDEVTQGINIPIIVAGGSKTEDFSDFLTTMKRCILAGAVGVSVGRNIFQADDPMTAMQMVREVVVEAMQETGKHAVLFGC
ncbi:MAG: 2-amino-3,7-dideoxy-D-threo-hept-6-ulosonate synthase [Candidatus Kariarchaeaceae archaeon]